MEGWDSSYYGVVLDLVGSVCLSRIGGEQTAGCD
jgi:hypothetical protein